MYTMDICIDDVLNELSKNHKITYKGNVNKAYEYAAKMHKGQKRKTGEPYIMHPLRVARLIASWGFESDLVCVALLHDVVEDCESTLEDITELFGSTISKTVDAVTAIHHELQEAENPTKEELDTLSDVRLQEKMSEKALYIKVADRIDNLRTIDKFPEEKKIAKAKHTREIIIPMLIKEGAFELVDILEDLCLKIEHPDRYTTINNTYTELLNMNSFTTNKVLKLLSEVFTQNSSHVPSDLYTYLNYVTDFTYNPRSTISVYRQINHEAENLTRDMPKLLHKKNIAMYDLTLVINDNIDSLKGYDNASELSPIDVFYKLYEQILSDRNIYILDYRMTTYGDSKYFVLCDKMDNLYRLFIKTETEYMRYKLGHIIDIEDVLIFEHIDNIDPRDTYNQKIKVFKRDKAAMYIDAGATMLDFAFAIHSEIGRHFDYAIIDDSKTQHKAYERLNEGDTITIVTNPNIEPKLQWFKYVKTSKAVEHLIKLLST